MRAHAHKHINTHACTHAHAYGCARTQSTIVGLILRYYDPLEGSVRVDGRLVGEYNLAWLRSQIGLVSQEPLLFATTIKDNIRCACVCTLVVCCAGGTRMWSARSCCCQPPPSSTASSAHKCVCSL